MSPSQALSCPALCRELNVVEPLARLLSSQIVGVQVSALPFAFAFKNVHLCVAHMPCLLQMFCGAACMAWPDGTLQRPRGCSAPRSGYPGLSWTFAGTCSGMHMACAHLLPACASLPEIHVLHLCLNPRV